MHGAELERGHGQGVTVRCGQRAGGVPHGAAAPGAIDHDHRLANSSVKSVGNKSRDTIGAAAGGPGYDQIEGAIGITRRAAASFPTTAQQQAERKNGQGQERERPVLA